MKSKASICFGGGGGAESIGAMFVRGVVLWVFACLTIPLYARRNDDRPGPHAGDFADFAAHWRRSDCRAANAWCSAADYTGDGAVLLDDLQEFAAAWLNAAQ